MLSVKNLWERKVAVFTDDLTGANEIAEIMTKRGKKTLVVNNPFQIDSTKMQKLWDDYGGLVFTLILAIYQGGEAYDKVKRFLNSFKEVGEHLIYKKVDSTLRGNLGQEIDAVVDVKCVDILVLVPALPKTDRITVGGYHLVKGVPVSKTFYAQNFNTSFLPKLLKSQSKHSAGYVSLQTVELGSNTISDQLAKEHKKGISVVICDCCTQEDLKRIKEAIFDSKLKVLPIGSAGLFEEILSKAESLSLPSLIVCGSLNKVTRTQLTKLMSHKTIDYLELDLFSVLSERKQDNEFKHLLTEGKNILKQKRDLVIATPEKRLKIKEPENINTIEKKINQSLALLAERLICNHPLAGVIATGGDTAMALLESLNAHTVEIIDDVEPLVPVGVIKEGRWKGLTIITKTGGFGKENVFLKALNYLKKKSRKIER